jgi:hypothetical protein
MDHIHEIEQYSHCIDSYVHILQDYLSSMSEIEKGSDLLIEFNRNRKVIELLLSNVSEKAIDIVTVIK